MTKSDNAQGQSLHWKRSLWWFAPLAVSQLAIYLLAVWGRHYCGSTPIDDCGIGWLALGLYPVLFGLWVIGWVASLVGILVLTWKFIRYRRIRSNGA